MDAWSGEKPYIHLRATRDVQLMTGRGVLLSPQEVIFLPLQSLEDTHTGMLYLLLMSVSFTGYWRRGAKKASAPPQGTRESAIQ